MTWHPAPLILPGQKFYSLLRTCLARHARTHACMHTQSCPTLCEPVDQFCRPDRSLLPWAADLPNAGIEPWSPVLQVDPLPTELSGKPQAPPGQVQGHAPRRRQAGWTRPHPSATRWPPPLPRPTSQQRARPGLNEEAYIRGTSSSGGTVLRGLTSFPWPRCPPGSADWFAPCRKASSPEGGCEEKTPWGRHSSSSADHTPFFFPGQFGCLTEVFMLRKPGAEDQGAAPISARGLTPFHFFSLRAGGEVQ